MKPPEEDLEDRRAIWDLMQEFWMDTDPSILFPRVVQVCADSKYDIDELEVIFWNEVRPAVSFNLSFAAGPAPAWVGFDIEWLTRRVLDTHRFGRRLPISWLHPYARHWWRRLRGAVLAERERGAG